MNRAPLRASSRVTVLLALSLSLASFAVSLTAAERYSLTLPAWVGALTFSLSPCHRSRVVLLALGLAIRGGSLPDGSDGGEAPSNKKIYYHYGLDCGGAEGLVDVIAATAGRVISSGTNRLAGYEESPAKPRYDVVYLLDDRGWYYRYSHLQSIATAMRPGATVQLGQKSACSAKKVAAGAGPICISTLRAGSPPDCGAFRKATRSCGRPISESRSPNGSPSRGRIISFSPAKKSC